MTKVRSLWCSFVGLWETSDVGISKREAKQQSPFDLGATNIYSTTNYKMGFGTTDLQGLSSVYPCDTPENDVDHLNTCIST